LAPSSSSSARSVALAIETSADWFGVDGVSVVKSNDGATVNYTADWKAAGLWIAKEKAAIENHTVEIDFVASQEFKTNGGNLYIYLIFAESPWTEYTNCSWFMSAGINANTPQTISCTISSSGVFSQTTYPIHIRLVARVDSGQPAPSGTVLITGGRILAP
jgi:Carbohydrate binding domain (family 15)